MEYGYEFEYVLPEMMEGVAEGAFMGAAGLVFGVVLLVYLLALAVSVAGYVLGAVGLYRIAKRRGIHHAWMAWIPVGNSWLLGSVSDHYQYVVKKKTTKRRKILLVLNILSFVISVLVMGGFLLLSEMFDAANGVILLAALIGIGYMVLLGLSVALMVFCYIAYFDLFRSCKPKSDVLFLVLGILFNAVLPFFVFACSSADDGMPVRRNPQKPVIADEPEEAAPAEEEVPVVETELVEDSE